MKPYSPKPYSARFRQVVVAAVVCVAAVVAVVCVAAAVAVVCAIARQDLAIVILNRKQMLVAGDCRSGNSRLLFKGHVLL